MSNVRYIKDIFKNYKFAKVQNLNIELELKYAGGERKEYLKGLYKNNKIVIDKIDTGLSALNQYELNIMKELYLNSTPITNKALYEKLGLTEQVFYRDRNKTIHKFMMKAYPVE